MVDTTKQTAVHYGAISFFTTILHNVFLLYHIQMFLSVYHIDKTSFWIGEGIFLLWNSVNDPLFGWLGDRGSLAPKSSNDSYSIVQRRIFNLSIFGPLLAGSFLLFWIDWMMPAIQFALCLCLYDSFLTMIDLHHSALLAELAITMEERTRMNSYQSVFSALGATSVFLSYIFWQDKHKFKMFCITLAVIAAIGFYITSRALSRTCSKIPEHIAESSSCQPKIHSPSDWSKMKNFVKQLWNQHNFMYFAIVNVVQVFHCHFNSNFFPIFLGTLLGDASTFGSILLGISFVLPHINNVFFLVLCRKYGVYVVMEWLFYVKFLLSILMLFAGVQNTWIVCIFIASNRIFTEGTCKLLSLVISDLIDEDCVKNARKEPISALMFGMANFLAKPGQTFAPLFGTALLSIYTGREIFHSNVDQIPQELDLLSDVDRMTYREASFQIVVFIPIGCAIIQIFAWRFYKLRGKYLGWIRKARYDAVDTFKGAIV